jgi:hypothetical protein
MEVYANGRYLIYHKKWGDAVFEIYLEEIAPSGEWFKISENRKKPSRWHKKTDVVFIEKLLDVEREVEDVLQELE